MAIDYNRKLSGGQMPANYHPDDAQYIDGKLSMIGIEERGKLDAEMREHDDIVQIDMSDHENFTSAKSLVAVRWANTFCADARQMFVLSDLAVLNLKQFEKMLKNKNFTATSSELNSNGLLKGNSSS